MIKNLFGSLSICFSMYSTIPTFKVDWSAKNMKYIFCFFPLVGIVIGGIEYLWFWLATTFSLSVILYAAVATVIPVLLSGGIHIDGYIDSCDAIFSYGDIEKRLNILKDPNVGAFGVIYSIVYFLLTFGLFASLFDSSLNNAILILCLSYGFCRTLSGLAAINMKSAKSSGLQHLFSENSGKKISTVSLIVWGILLYALIAFFNIYIAIISGILIGLFFLKFRAFTKKNFGGINGDLVGLFLCILEFIMLICCVLGGLLL